MSREQELREQLITKAWSDPAFKERLLADPKAAIEDAFGIKVPYGVNITVLEEANENLYLVLPQKPTEVMALDDSVNAPSWV